MFLTPKLQLNYSTEKLLVGIEPEDKTEFINRFADSSINTEELFKYLSHDSKGFHTSGFAIEYIIIKIELNSTLNFNQTA